jgi:hypothetical protein
MRKKHDHNFKEFWDIIKTPNLRIHEVEEGVKIWTKVIEILLNEIVAKNFPNLRKYMDIQI